MYEYLAFLPIMLPIAGAILTFILSRFSQKLMDAFLIVFSILLFVFYAAYFLGIQGHSITPMALNSIACDPVSAFIACLTSFLGMLIIFYSFVYKDNPHYGSTYFIMYFLLMGMIIGLASTYNVVVMLIFLEAATVISAVLILFGRTKRAIRATYIYLAISIVEVILVVAGAFILYNDAGTLDLSHLHANVISQNDMFLLALLFFFGFGTKAGLLPLGIIWLPPAHSEAPPPISATMSGILVMASVIAMVKAIYPFFLISNIGTLTIVILCFGVLNMLAGLAGALWSEDFKRLLAYSTVASIGYILLGFGLATPTSIYGALAYITNHMLFKGGLFLIAGALILRVHTRQMHKMGGLLKQMPITAICFLIMALAISGVPLLNGYLSKELIYQGAVQSGYQVYFSAFGIDFTIFAVVGWLVSLILLYCFMRAFYLIFLGKPKEEHKDVSDPPVSMMLPILILAGLCIVIGIYPDLLSGALQYVASTLFDLTHI